MNMARWRVITETAFFKARSIAANSVLRKRTFLANGSSLNALKLARNDFEARPGAIDGL